MRFSWLTLFLLALLVMTCWSLPRNIAYPDSHELYSYKSPRSMQDLQNQHMRQAMMDVTDTISEVQQILEQDKTLPRLTRGEIEDLFEMVTREEYKRSLAAGDFERAKHMRSLMLVLPINTNNYSEERLQELFTRSPVTKMVYNDIKKPKPQQVIIMPSMSANDMTAAHSYDNQIRSTFKPNYVVSNGKEAYIAPATTFHPKATIQTAIFTQKEVKPIPSTYHPKATTKHLPIENYPSTLKDSPLVENSNKMSSTYSAQTTSFTPSSPPPMRKNVKDLLATIGLQPDTSIYVTPITEKPTTTLASTKAKIISTTRATTTTTTTTTTTPKPELTPELKELLDSFGLLTNEAPPPYVTAGPYQDEFQPIFPSALIDETLSVSEFKPLPKSISNTDIETKLKEQPLETHADDFSSFKPIPKSDDKPSADVELENLLKTYGLIENDSARGMKALDAQNDELKQKEKVEKSKTEIETEKPEIDAEKITKLLNIPPVDVPFLSPDLIEVLGRMGIKNMNSQQSTTKLNKFESIPATTTTTTTTTEAIEASTITTTSEVLTESPPILENDFQKLHHLLDTIRELDKLNANLTKSEWDKLNVKNFNFSDELLNQGPDPIDIFYNDDSYKNEVKRQLSNSSSPTKITLDLTATTPVSSNVTDDDGDNENDNDDINDDEFDADKKNATKTDDDSFPVESIGDEKRSGDSDDFTVVSSSTSTTTEESKNANLMDLADSFGGSDGLDAVSEEPLPTPKKNGFYFFSDWNSFLEVGEDKDKVIVRFDPKVGDPSHFIPVKIP